MALTSRHGSDQNNIASMLQQLLDQNTAMRQSLDQIKKQQDDLLTQNSILKKEVRCIQLRDKQTVELHGNMQTSIDDIKATLKFLQDNQQASDSNTNTAEQESKLNTQTKILATSAPSKSKTTDTEIASSSHVKRSASNPDTKKKEVSFTQPNLQLAVQHIETAAQSINTTLQEITVLLQNNQSEKEHRMNVRRKNKHQQMQEMVKNIESLTEGARLDMNTDVSTATATIDASTTSICSSSDDETIRDEEHRTQCMARAMKRNVTLIVATLPFRESEAPDMAIPDCLTEGECDTIRNTKCHKDQVRTLVHMVIKRNLPAMVKLLKIIEAFNPEVSKSIENAFLELLDETDKKDMPKLCTVCKIRYTVNIKDVGDHFYGKELITDGLYTKITQEEAKEGEQSILWDTMFSQLAAVTAEYAMEIMMTALRNKGPFYSNITRMLERDINAHRSFRCRCKPTVHGYLPNLGNLGTPRVTSSTLSITSNASSLYPDSMTSEDRTTSDESIANPVTEEPPIRRKPATEQTTRMKARPLNSSWTRYPERTVSDPHSKTPIRRNRNNP